MQKYNNLLVYYLSIQMLLLVSVDYKTNLLSNINLELAFTFQFFSMVMVFMGYSLFYYISKITKKQDSKDSEKRFFFTKSFFYWSYFLCVFGVSIVIIQTSLNQSPIEYLQKIFSGNFDQNIRNDFLLSSENGGLSGMLKIFGFAPLSIYLATSAIIKYIGTSENNLKQLKKLNMFSLITVLIKILFSLDRLSLLAIVLVYVFIAIEKRKILKAKFILAFVSILLIATFISSKRLKGYDILDFVLLYSKLGLVNLQLMIETVDGHTYGFSTFLSPLNYMLSVVGEQIKFSSNYDYEWNPAQIFSSNMYQDFGLASLIAFVALGFLLSWIDWKFKKRNIYFVSIYFIVLYAVGTTFIVPAIRGMEFWLALIIPLVLIKFFVKRSKTTI